MRNVIVKSGFKFEKLARVTNDILRIPKALKHVPEIEKLTFASEKNDTNSKELFKPNTYCKIQAPQSLAANIPVWQIGAVGNEFTVLRYRKRKTNLAFVVV